MIAQKQRIRITFISGDVHCAAVGVLKTLKHKKAAEINSSVDHRYMLNIVTSMFFPRLLGIYAHPVCVAGAIVNTPP